MSTFHIGQRVEYSETFARKHGFTKWWPSSGVVIDLQVDGEGHSPYQYKYNIKWDKGTKISLTKWDWFCSHTLEPLKVNILEYDPNQQPDQEDDL